MEISNIFAPLVSDSEWQSVPADIGKKIYKWVNDELESLITAKALAETNRFTAESNLSELRVEYENVSAENTSLKSRLDTAVNTMNEIESQLSTVTADLAKLQQQCNKYELDIAEYRHQRNMAVDERDEHRKMIQKRNAEIERLQMDINSLTKQLEQAVNAKCEALAQADEVASMKLTLEYKEKRMEQERALFTSQMESLTEDLNQRTEELLNMRRDNTSRCIQLETKLAEKTQELAIATEHIKSLTELNNNMTTRNEELSAKLLNQREVDSKMNESYLYEIEAKSKMANTYKTMYEESQQHSEELKEALTEVQDLLKTATEKYGDLETKHKEMELANEEILAKKNECIAMLKRELNIANEVLENSSANITQHNEGEEFSTAASTSSSRLLKSGMTVTEVYSQFVAVSEKLANKEQECARLNNYITCIVREIEEKGPLIKKLREDYSRTLDANDALKESNDSLLNELQQLRELSGENKRMEGVTMRENQRLKKEVSDLSRQVCHLLQEVENSRTGGSSSTSDMELSDSICSADIISKKLVTFNDISEMQANNQKLLAVVRELTERQEEVESFDPAAISALKRKLDELRDSQNELLEERDKQNKMMMTLRNQRDMYKNLYTQASKNSGDDLAAQLDNDDCNKTQTESDSQSVDKMHEFESQIETYKKKLDNLKEEFEQYRKEKCANEKILIEQLENARSEVKELTKLNCKQHSHAEMNEEKCKILQNNCDIYKKQITALEKQNKIFSESIIKHEQAANYLKEETLQSQTKLSRAEVMLANLQKENALLRDAENRLVKEREMLKRESHQQNLIHTNIELIKAALERADAESKLRLESRLDEAHRECSALRRRLQEEQDNFRQLSDHLKQQTEQAQRRMEEEKLQADKLRRELIEVRDELTNKSTQIEELTKKLRLSILEIPEHNVDGRRIRELENQLADAQAEIESLTTKWKTTKEASEQYFNVAENAERQMKEAIEQRDGMQAEIVALQAQVKELEEKCSELQGELSIQLDDQDMANASIKSKSHQLQEELSSTATDLQTARQQLDTLRTEYRVLSEQLKAVENKYAREVMLHSADLQQLSAMKESLNAVQDEVNELRCSRDQAREALEETQRTWQEQERIINREKESMVQRFKDMESQNALLLDQIQALNTHLTVLQAQASADQSTMSESSFNRSFAEDEVKSSEQLLKIIKYLRQEKDIAVSKADIMEAEHARLKSQYDLVCKQLEEAKVIVEQERQKSEVSVVSASKHSEVLRKLETLNAITDSNRSLRQERDGLLKEIAELRERVNRLETEMAPLQEKNRDLSTKADQMQSENISLRAEATRWRQRANMLIEKTNRTSPEDWKKLQNERENLAKQLTIERSTTTKLNDDINNLRQEKLKLDDQLKSVRAQNNTLTEEVSQMKESINSLQTQHNQITLNLEQMQEENKKMCEENRVLSEDRNGKDVVITELRNNLGQIRKIAKKYKTQSEEYYKELETLKQQQEEKSSEQSSASERQEQLIQEQRTELEERVSQLEATHKEAVDQLNQQVTSSTEQIEGFKKEIENLKQTSYEKEERFKNLFKNAKERIVTLTEQNNNLKEELSKLDRTGTKPDDVAGEGSSKHVELLEKIEHLQREKEEILADRQQEKEKLTNEMETLMQRVNQLQRQLGLQQGSKPSTSSGTTEKLATEPPTANIKPMAGHSTNTQTQSVPIQPWRSVGEPPLASIRPMSAQLRTVAVLPTSQSPSAVMIPPQQQVHTTGTSTMEAALSSSPTSSHTDYVAATSSASSAMLGARQQVAVPPTQSSQDTEDDENNVQMQSAPQQQAVALVLPRIEPPSSGSGGGPTQEQGTSSSSSNTVTTTQASLKRQRDADTDSQSDEQNKQRPMQQSKRTRLQQAGSVSESVLEVEYQVPTSSQRDHDDDNVILVESDDDGGPDEGEGADDEQDDPDTEGYDIEGMEQDNYEDADCQDVEDEEEAGNEVEVIEDSSEVPNQSERSILDCPEEEGNEQQQSEAISSGTAEGSSSSGVTLSQASTSMTMTIPSNSRTRPVAPLPSRSQHHHHHHPLQQQSHLLLSSHGGLEEAGDDGIVPSTPTLFVPRRSDGEAVSSPHVPTSGRFTFSETLPPSTHAGSSEVVPEQTLEVAQVDDNSTGRSVPTTPLQASPQESVPGSDEQGSHQNTQSDAEIPTIRVDVSELSEEAPNVAGPSSEGSQQPEQAEEMLEGDDEVSSEGEKPLQPEEGGEEEGREAEASPSTNTRLRHLKNIPSVRRSLRSPVTRGSVLRSGPPTPIVWSDPQQQTRQQHQQPTPPHLPQQASRGGSPVFPRAVARRARSRIQRPYGRF